MELLPFNIVLPKAFFPAIAKALRGPDFAMPDVAWMFDAK